MPQSFPSLATPWQGQPIVVLPIGQLRPEPRNARTHSKAQVEKIAQSIRRFGFVNPVLIDAEQRIVAGHGRVAAARLLGIEAVPTLVISHLTAAELRAYRIADNKLAELAGWDAEILAIEFAELKNICVWDKGRGGMGSLYRSAHELVFVFKSGTAPHINNVALGQHGRNRTNLWRYAGANSPTAGRKQKLALHPTVKPVALVADAMLDASHRGDIVLDVFGGSGTTILAAERTGRRARVIELEPGYVDVAVERWQRMTGSTARHLETGLTFAEQAAQMAASGAHAAAA